MVQCVIKNCGLTDKLHQFRTFHKVPKSIVMREKWVEAIGVSIEGIFYVCDRHFLPSDYGKSCLKKFVVPSKDLIIACKRKLIETEEFKDYEFADDTEDKIEGMFPRVRFSIPTFSLIS